MDGKKTKILLCEDDQNLGMVLKNFLELNDFDVTLERDGRPGLAAFQREKFDICLLDIMMPHMDGFRLAEEIRDVDPDIPLFFLSAKTMKDDIIQDHTKCSFDFDALSASLTKPARNAARRTFFRGLPAGSPACNSLVISINSSTLPSLLSLPSGSGAG